MLQLVKIFRKNTVFFIIINLVLFSFLFITEDVDAEEITHTFKLFKGWNLITIPVKNNYTAKTLLNDISGCTEISSFDPITQKYINFKIDNANSVDFSIKDGVGYYINVTYDTFFTVIGIPIKSDSVVIYGGWNTLGWYHDYNITAQSYGQNIIDCTVVVMFNASSQGYFSYIVGVNWDNFNISKGMGISVFISDSEPPSKVTGLTVVDAKDGKLNLSWNAASDNYHLINYYKIYRNGGYLTKVNYTSYQDTGLTNGISYKYTISAVDTSENEAEQSDQVSNIPTKSPDKESPKKVTGLIVTDFHDGKLNLKWNAALDNVAVDYYKIYRDGEYLTNVYTTFYLDTGLTNNELYIYTISAVDTSNNEGEKSEPKSGTPTEIIIEPDIEYGWVYGKLTLRYLDGTLPAENVSVCIYPGVENVSIKNIQGICNFTDKNGNYYITNIETGTYILIAFKGKLYSNQEFIEIRRDEGTEKNLIINIDENRWQIEEAIEKGDLGGEIFIEQENKTRYVYEIIQYEQIDIEPIDISKGNILLLVSGDQLSLGKTILINVDNNVFDLTKDLIIKYDDETINLAEDFEDILNPNDDSHHPEYLILYGSSGIQFFVSIPKFSTHKITIFNFEEIVETVDTLGIFILYFMIIIITMVAVVLHMKYMWGK